MSIDEHVLSGIEAFVASCIEALCHVPAPPPPQANGGDHLFRSLGSLHAMSLIALESSRLLRRGTFATQRDIYYTHTSAFATQRHAENAVTALLRQLAHSGVVAVAEERISRELLHITAGTKSVVVGELLITFASGATIDVGSFGTSGAPIAHDFGDATAISARAAVLVVVEKEASLQQLIAEGAHRHVALLCGRGYPCVAGRQFLAAVARLKPKTKIRFLVDGDAHGLGIFITYLRALLPGDVCATIRGTRTKRDRSSNAVPDDAAPAAMRSDLDVEWCGVRPLRVSLPPSQWRIAPPANIAKLATLRAELTALLRCCPVDRSPLLRERVTGWLEEVGEMQRTGREAELQALGALSGWVAT